MPSSHPPAEPAPPVEADAAKPAGARWVLLHEHLDGGLRPATLIELARARGMALPADTPAALAAWFVQQASAGSLEAFLKTFALTIEALASEAALERVAREAAEDALAEGCALAEFRCAPHLFEPWGVSAEAATQAMLRGLQAVPALPSGLILCGIRNHPPALSERVAHVAVRYAVQGVVGFDLAGGEVGHPPAEHAAAFAVAREAGLPITCHAGEADGPERVLEAARLGATRIGHGVRLADCLQGAAPRAWLDEVIARGLHLEICVTSNVQTGAAARAADHPIAALWAAGVSLSFHTDNRLMCGTTMGREARRLIDEAACTDEDLRAMTRAALAASFLPGEVRQRVAPSLDGAWNPRQGGAGAGVRT